MSPSILSCPPDECMKFGCPGHKSSRKGLSGCGVDTVMAPVGTLFSVGFTVLDYSTPPALSSVQRMIMVVSPCSQEEIYCPDLVQPVQGAGELACGSSDCVSRAAMLSLQPEQPVSIAPTVEFSHAVPSSAVYTPPAGRTSATAAIPGEASMVLSQVYYLNHFDW